jgi:hypothetical protein
MKKIYSLKFLAITSLLLVSIEGKSQIFTEHFNYTSTGNLLTDTLSKISIPAGTTTVNWMRNGGYTNVQTFNPVMQSSVSLSYGTYPSIGGSVGFSTFGEDVSRQVPIAFTGTRYLSAIIRIDSATTTGNTFFGYGETSAGSSSPTAQLSQAVNVIARSTSQNTYQLGVFKGSQTYTGSAVYGGSYTYGQPVFVILKIQFLNGTTDDVVSMHVFSGGNMPPALESSSSPQTFVNSPSFIDPFQVNRVFIRQENSTTPKGRIDFIRHGLTWSDVTSVPSTASLNEITNTQQLTLLGNPVNNGKLTLMSNIPNINDLGYTIYNVLGQSIQSGKMAFENQKCTLDATNFPNGQYFLTFTTEHGGNSTIKFSKNN